MFNEITVYGEQFSLDNLPPVDRWVYSPSLEEFIEKGLFNVVGFSNVYDYATLPDIKFTHWYWQAELEVRMQTVGLFYLTYVTGVKLEKLKSEEKPLDIYLVLMDRDYIMERLLRDLSPLGMDKDELTDFLTEDFITHYDARQHILEEQKIKTWVSNSPIPVTYEQVKAMLDAQKVKVQPKALTNPKSKSSVVA